MKLGAPVLSMVLVGACTVENSADSADASVVPTHPPSVSTEGTRSQGGTATTNSRLREGQLRPRSPLSQTLATAERVEFAWSPAVRARLELARSPGFEPIDTELFGEGTAEARLAAGRWFWRVASEDGKQKSVAWQLSVVPRGTNLVRQGTQYANDVNGDGLDDLILSSGVVLGHSGPFKGKANFRRMAHREDPFPADAAPHPLGLNEMSPIPVPSDWVGDVNGDGCSDIVTFGGEEPRLILGSTDLDTAWRVDPAEIGVKRSQVVRRLGDVNRDGYADVAFRTEGGWAVLLGGPEGLARSWSAILDDYPAIAGGGDFDGDGFDDVAAIDRQDRILLLLGGPDGFLEPMVASSNAGREQLSTNTGVIIEAKPRIQLSDMDGDGLSDIIGASVPRSPAGFGEVWWIRGRPGRKTLGPVARQAWPFRLDRELSFSTLSLVFMPRMKLPSSAIVISSEAAFAEDFWVVPVDCGRLDVSRRHRHSDSHPGRFSATLGALGDFDGDGCEDLFELESFAIGGSGFRIFAGSSLGDGIGEMMTEQLDPWGESSFGPPETPFGAYDPG